VGNVKPERFTTQLQTNIVIEEKYLICPQLEFVVVLTMEKLENKTTLM